MRGDPREDQIKRLVKQLKTLGVDIKHENHQMIINSVRKVSVEESGIVIQ
jgi:5-enolpyruvylshikimate-3-phosphate synthase